MTTTAQLLSTTTLVAARGSPKARSKVGFTREGVLRSAGFVHAGRVDLAVYSKINTDLEH